MPSKYVRLNYSGRFCFMHTLKKIRQYVLEKKNRIKGKIKIHDEPVMNFQ
jgi:hypothetical protein